MKLRKEDLKTERQWRSATGLDQVRFKTLLEGFKKSYLALHHGALSEQIVGDVEGYCIQSEEELLLFTLFSLKSGLTFDLLGFVTGMDAANAYRNQHKGVAVLTRTLSDKGCLPKRNILNLKDFEAYFEKDEALILDAAEQAIQRPGDRDAQEEHYSGKKNGIR
jgi:hypothetical protein